MVQHPTNPIPETLESIPGFPDHLQIYRIPASKYWYARCHLGKRIVRSMKTEKHANAVAAAKDFYNELLLKRSQGQPLTQSNSFQLAAEAQMKEDQSRVDRRECKQSVVDDFSYIYEKDLLPFFRRDHVRAIGYKRIQEYVAHLQERGVGSKTIKNHFIQLNKVLTQAHKLEWLDRLPTFPTISVQDNPRGWFTDDQFTLLQKTIRNAIKDKVKVQRAIITDELLHLTNFMVNTFLRPTDVKVLRNRDVTLVRRKRPGQPDLVFLKIMAKGKVKPSPVVSTTAAVAIYERIKGAPDEFVFFKQYARSTAMGIMSKQFRHVLRQAGLYETDDGQTRALHSLRHTCITNQLIHGSMPIALVAKNCRTSIEMIQRFYGSHAEAERNVHQLHQPEEAGDSLEDFFEDERLA